jgi:HK97 gp10 family phage protein
MAGETIRINGLDDALRELRELPRKLRIGALRKGLRAAGRVIQVDARTKAPVLQQATPYRTRGLVRRSITVRASRIARKRGDLGVFVTVAASKQGRQRGAFTDLRSKKVVRPNDPFYFRFLEMGTKKMAARPFLGPALQSKSREATDAFSGELRKAIAIANTRR